MRGKSPQPKTQKGGINTKAQKACSRSQSNGTFLRAAAALPHRLALDRRRLVVVRVIGLRAFRLRSSRFYLSQLLLRAGEIARGLCEGNGKPLVHVVHPGFSRAYFV